MLKIAIASGKGGTGKTTIAVNLALTIASLGQPVTLLDCDVEEPNCHLFLKPEITGSRPVTIPQRQSGVGVYLKVLPTLMGNGVMYKCDLCSDLLKENKTPACIEACPQKAMSIGPRKEILAKAEELAKRIGGYLYGKDENDGTGTLYVSPVPFELLDAAVQKGPGQPGLGRVKRRMAGTDAMGKAVLAAPALGIAAGLAGAFAFISKRKDKSGKKEE